MMSQAEPNNEEIMRQQKYPACLSVVVPVYNEGATLLEVVEKLLKVPCLLEIIIVDDCSTDTTSQVANELVHKHPQVRCVRHERNKGKTAALRTGFALTTGEVVIVQDADLEYDPPRFMVLFVRSSTAMLTSFSAQGFLFVARPGFFTSITFSRINS